MAAVVRTGRVWGLSHCLVGLMGRSRGGGVRFEDCSIDGGVPGSGAVVTRLSGMLGSGL